MEAINEFLMKHQLQLETDGVKRKYLCNICGKILCKPKIGICNCSYCSSCFINNRNKNNECPSCKTYLNFETEVMRDIRMENKILKLQITCPNVLCYGKYTINELSTHLQMCDKKRTKCLFHMYGCSVFVNSDSDMHEHLSRDLKYHLNLLLNNTSENNNPKDEKMYRIDREIIEKNKKINLIDEENMNELNPIDREVNDKMNQIDREIIETKNKVNEINEENKKEINRIDREINDKIDRIYREINDKLNQIDREGNDKMNQLNGEMIETKNKVNRIDEENKKELNPIDREGNDTKNQINGEIIETKNKVNQIDEENMNEINRIDRKISDKLNQIDQEMLESNSKIMKLCRDFEQLKESMDARILKCEAYLKLELENSWSEIKTEAESKSEIEKLRVGMKTEVESQLNLETLRAEKTETESKLELEKLREEIKTESESKLEVKKLRAGRKTKAELKWEKLKGDLNKTIEEKSAEISRLRDKLNEKTRIAEIGEHFVVGDGQYKVTFGDMILKIKNKFYESKTFTLFKYDFKIYMRYITKYDIEFAVCIVKGNNTQSKWPLTNKLTLILLGKDGHVYTNHKFSYATSPEEEKHCYISGGYLQDSVITVWHGSVINNYEVSLILTMEE